MWVGLDLCDGLGWVEYFLTHHGGLGKKSQPDPCTPLALTRENQNDDNKSVEQVWKHNRSKTSTHSHREEEIGRGCEEEREGSLVPIFPPLRFRTVGSLEVFIVENEAQNSKCIMKKNANSALTRENQIANNKSAEKA